MTKVVAVSLLLATLGTADEASAYPGEKFIQRRAQAYREARAQKLRTKQENLLIQQHPELAKVWAIKKAEYKANHSVFSFPLVAPAVGGAIGLASHGNPVATAIGVTWMGAQTVGLGALVRNHEAKSFAHGETMKYAAAHKIKLAPKGMQLGVVRKE